MAIPLKAISRDGLRHSRRRLKAMASQEAQGAKSFLFHVRFAVSLMPYALRLKKKAALTKRAAFFVARRKDGMLGVPRPSQAKRQAEPISLSTDPVKFP